ncbi:MAG: hypothetical protein JF597_48695 [Streptomyces sp.]|jgi:hypothetical protein|uniref:hypothetical protein n=1 Tax=unclassified Streptomyces TaxID=2593676 RepID=UPI0025DD353F|nr:hypothetical protein [Streptomyces sp.]MBW8801155.1 hypothetical protein [Streptomyces sp.]
MSAWPFDAVRPLCTGASPMMLVRQLNVSAFDAGDTRRDQTVDVMWSADSA